MSAAVYLPDPLLSRATPAASEGGFSAEALLTPVRAGFALDPLLAPPLPSAEPGQEQDRSQAERRAGDETDAGFPAETPLTSTEPVLLDALQLSPELQAQLEQRYREGFEEGLSQGAGLATSSPAEGSPEGTETDGTALGAEHAASDRALSSGSRDVVLLLEALSRALQPLLLPDDAAARFEPLKRLALHLATELVRQELSLSPRVVDELVRRSVQALQAGEQAPLTVELHPQDLALLQLTWDNPSAGLPQDAAMRQRVNWLEDPQLSRGSVRARSDASTVEDLIQHRLASIMQDLRIQSLQWQRDEAPLQQAADAGEPDA
jgi:flagellar biosynthesis/type III secretory pathway protein FliH